MCDLAGLGSWRTLVAELESLLQSPSPPDSIFVQSAHNIDLVYTLVQETCDRLDGGGFPRAIGIDLVELTSPRAVFDRALNGLANWIPEWSAAGAESWDGRPDGCSLGPPRKRRKASDGEDIRTGPCAQWGRDSNGPLRGKGLTSQHKNESMDGFFDGLRILEELRRRHGEGAGRPRFLILQHADRLRGWTDGHFLASMTRLRDLSSTGLHPIFVSRLPWSKIRPRHGALEPAVVTVPPLSLNDTQDLLVSEAQRTANLSADSGLSAFVSLVVSSFEGATGVEVTELLHLVVEMWPQWCDVAARERVNPSDTAKLVTLSRGLFDKAKEQYGRPKWHAPAVPPIDSGIAAADGLPGRPLAPSADASALAFPAPALPRGPASTSDTGEEVPSMPARSRLLLAASFIASYNPQRTDMRLLCSYSGDYHSRRAPRHRAPKPGQEVKRKDRQQLIGPKQFGLERLEAVYQSLTAALDCSEDSADLQQQIASSCRSQSLMRASAVAADKLDGQRFKCGVDEARAASMASHHGVKSKGDGAKQKDQTAKQALKLSDYMWEAE